jgi:hypothetical protein
MGGKSFLDMTTHHAIQASNFFFDHQSMKKELTMPWACIPSTTM